MTERGLITENVIDELSKLMGGKIEYYTDEGRWEEVYLSGFESSPYRVHIEVFPPRDTEWGRMWHKLNDKIPFPFPGHDARLKVTDPSRLRLPAIESQSRISEPREEKSR